MTYTANAQKLEAASERVLDLIELLTHTVETGRDSSEYASKVAVLAQQFALASTDYCEALSTVHCDNLDLNGETPCENSDDFAEWAKQVSLTRSVIPFEGIRSPRVQYVDLRPVIQAAE